VSLAKLARRLNSGLSNREIAVSLTGRGQAAAQLRLLG
jgi:hypothetical protein